jgi:hypothetical protein
MRLARPGRRIAVTAMLVVATLLWAASILGVWAKRQALSTYNWVETSSRLLENEDIRDALGAYLVDQLYAAAAVQEELEEVLPDRLDRLAAPAAAGLREVARRNVPRILGSGAAEAAWERANRQAHDGLLGLVEGRVDEAVRLRLGDLVTQVAEQTGLPAGVSERLSPDVADIEVVRPDQLDTAKEGLDLFRDGLVVLAVLAVGLYAGAIAVSRDRRRTLAVIGTCIPLAGIVVLAIRQLAGDAVVEALADGPNGGRAADDVWEIATSMLVDAAQGSVLLGVLVASAAWLLGPGRRATDLRRLSAPTLRERPAEVRAALGVALLLLVLWDPVPFTGQVVPVLLLAVAAFAWLELLVRRAGPPAGLTSAG